MKIIEAMKEIKAEQVAVNDLMVRIQKNSATTELEAGAYGPEQANVVKGWVQSCRDRIIRIARLKVAIQRTNVLTLVTIKLPLEGDVTKPIAEWILRRGSGKLGSLALAEKQVWSQLTDRELRDTKIQNKAGDPPIVVKVVRFYDPAERDQHLDALTREPSLIDAQLEIVNATTDLVDFKE